MKPQKVEISHKTIIFTVLFLISLAVIWQVKSLIILLFISFVFMEALNPAVSRLEKFKIPRVVSILILYAIILTVISFAIAGIVPILIEQTTGLINTLPGIIQNTKIFGATAIDFSSQFKILENVPSNIAKTAVSAVSNLFFSFYNFLYYLLSFDRKKKLL